MNKPIPKNNVAAMNTPLTHQPLPSKKMIADSPDALTATGPMPSAPKPAA